MKTHGPNVTLPGVLLVRRFRNGTELGAKREGDVGWFVYDRQPGEDWHQHCGPYSTFERAQGWINDIKDKRDKP